MKSGALHLLVLPVLFSLPLLTQAQFYQSSIVGNNFDSLPLYSPSKMHVYQIMLKNKSQSLLLQKESFSIPNLSTDASFFCRIETRINEVSGIPLRFRLGSLSYVNKLEGKEMYEAIPIPYLQKAGLRKRD